MKLTPLQSLYIKEILTGKKYSEIAKKLGVSKETIGTTFSRICQKLKMTKYEIIVKYYTGELKFEFTDMPENFMKYRQKQDRSEQIRLLKKMGFTDKEIIEELRHE